MRSLNWKANLALRAMLVLLAALTCAASASAAEKKAGKTAASATAIPNDLQILHVQGMIYVLTGADSNATVQIGQDGVLFVDTPAAALVPKAMELIRTIADKPVRYIVSTSLDAHYISGNEALTAFGTLKVPSISGGMFATAPVAAMGAMAGVSILGQENVLNRLTARDQTAIPGALITSTYFQPTKDFFLNGEGIIVYHVPNAHTDGDSIVHFRQSDVVSVGALFTPGRYPDIDVDKGGSIDGFLAGLNQILALTIPAAFQEGGTYVVPGYGRICDEADVVEYRDMVSIVRDRVEDLLNKGMSLAQVQAARPTLDYDTEHGGTRGGPTAQMFVQSIYKSLAPRKGAAR